MGRSGQPFNEPSSCKEKLSGDGRGERSQEPGADRGSKGNFVKGSNLPTLPPSEQLNSHLILGKEAEIP